MRDLAYKIVPRSVKPEEMQIVPPMILDIDLDGFYCVNPDEDDHLIYSNGEQGLGERYLQRTRRTELLLESLPRPRLITITKSQGTTAGNYFRHAFVPPKYVNKIQDDVIQMINELYR
jgi:hypothetical protein